MTNWNFTDNNAQKSVFGQPQPATGGAFGGGGTGLFGQQNTQGQQPTQQQPVTGLFGGGNNTGGGLFGQPAQQQQPQTNSCNYRH